MKVLAKRVNQKFEEMELGSDLKSMQEFVGGYIEAPFISKELRDKGIVIVTNEEAKIMKLEPTLAIVLSESWTVADCICGNYFFCSSDGDEFASLSEEQLSFLKEFIVEDACEYGEKPNTKKADAILI